jgi:hypothetical protein
MKGLAVIVELAARRETKFAPVSNRFGNPPRAGRLTCRWIIDPGSGRLVCVWSQEHNLRDPGLRRYLGRVA